MPIYRAKLPSGELGYKWGEHGHVYPSREGAENQAKAAYAHGYTGDNLTTAAGVALRTPDGKYLFVKDANRETWCFPGGKSEIGEDAEQTARRELYEETLIAHDGEFTPMARSIFNDVDYTTFTAPIHEAVNPTLDGENTDFIWAGRDELPEPLHPALSSILNTTIALDRAPLSDNSVRSKDRDGRLHVELTNISKANVCPYRGSEIPNHRELGLDPDKVYQLYRHPDELAKAAPTFNNVPLLSEHVPVDVKDYRPDLVIGATGSDAVFEAPYLKNSLVVWAGEAVNGIESERQKEISCAYYYTPDMTPGEVDGQPYDGVMRDIVANHVAIVVEGRAGPDVVVGDQKPENLDMPRVNKGRVDKRREAVTAYMRPKLAADATLDDINLLLEQLEESEPTAAEPVADDDDTDPVAKAKDLIKTHCPPEVYAKIEELLSGAASDDDNNVDMPVAGEPMGADDDEEKPIDKAAMDAAIKATEKAVVARMNAVRDAERAVKPFIGEMAMSFDSAEGVYRHALKVLGVDGVDGIHESALPTILSMQPKPGLNREAVAQDSAATSLSFAERHPFAARIKRN